MAKYRMEKIIETAGTEQLKQAVRIAINAKMPMGSHKQAHPVLQLYTAELVEIERVLKGTV